MRRAAPRPLAQALRAVTERWEPLCALAEIQRVWPEVVGSAIAREAAPEGERDGVLTVACSASVWAQELDLMGPALAARLNAACGREVVRSLRCHATPPSHRRDPPV